jgi:uncharacterized membrane protein YphA (DoxX/SURF4 family)
LNPDTVAIAGESLPEFSRKESPVRWRPITRVLFRFVSSYMLIYAICALSIAWGILAFSFLKRGYSFPLDVALKGVVPWFASHILRIRQPITNSLSGDSPFEWIENLLFLASALLSTLLWSALDPKRPNYRTLDQWLRLLIRFVLAWTMFMYGFDKVFPLQFHSISRYDLVRQFGDLDHFNVMWKFMAASKAYTFFSGFLEILAGVLLLVPRLTNVGALLCATVMANVFALNLAYNIPVKLFSFNLFLMAVFLIAPELPRLANVLVFNRPAPPVTVARLSRRKRIDRGARIVQGSLGVLALAAAFLGNKLRYAEVQKAAAVTVPLQGIWLASEFSVSGAPPQALFTPKLAAEMHVAPGEDHWLRLVFDEPNALVIQLLNGELDYVNLTLDKNAATATLSDSDDPNWKVQLTLRQPQPNTLELHGQVNGLTVTSTLHRVDESRFKIRDEGLHLVQ